MGNDRLSMGKSPDLPIAAYPGKVEIERHLTDMVLHHQTEGRRQIHFSFEGWAALNTSFLMKVLQHPFAISKATTSIQIQSERLDV